MIHYLISVFEKQGNQQLRQRGALPREEEQSMEKRPASGIGRQQPSKTGGTTSEKALRRQTDGSLPQEVLYVFEGGIEIIPLEH